MLKKREQADKILAEMVKLDAVEFLGVCKILGVDIYKDGAKSLEDSEPRDFVYIWNEVCNKVWALNRVQRRNLSKLVRAATKHK